MSKMSGVVVKLNDDEEDEDEEDDAGLLSRRGYDDSDDDDLDDLRHQSGSNSRGRSVLKRLRGAAGGDKSSLPYPSMRSGTVMQLLNTLTICCVFFGMGLTKSLIESPPTAAGIQTTEREMATSVGYVLGFLFGGFLLARFSRNFIMLLTLQVLGSMLVTVPWIDSDWATDTVYIIIGVCIAILMIGGNVICLDFWGRKSGAYIHALHFCLSLGLLTGPLLVDPLSSAHVPGLLRKALPFALSHSGGGGNSAAATAAGAAVGGTSHIIQKRSLESTLDPLLANIFGVDPNPIINPSPSTKTTTTISSIATTSSMMALQPKKKTPKPKLKPIFNDGQKLDNSRDWEKVKIAQPPIEDLVSIVSATTSKDSADVLVVSSRPSSQLEEEENIKETNAMIDITKLLSDDDDQSIVDNTDGTTRTPSDRSELIHQELSEVEEDLKENAKLLNWLNESMRRRKKRDIGISNSRQGFGMGVRPPLYNQRGRRPGMQQQPQFQIPDYPARKVQNINPYAYDYDYDLEPPAASYGVRPQTLEPPPREVEKAVETISNYLNNASLVTDAKGGQNPLQPSPKGFPSGGGLQPTITETRKQYTTKRTTTSTSSSKTKTTTSTTKRTKTSTDALITTQKKKISDSDAAVLPKKKKPTSSFDNDKDTNDGINNGNDTIKALLDNYGVSKSNIGFILDATYTWIISLILLVCMCYRPQRGEPRSRQEADEIFGSRSSEESRIFKATVTVLLFFFNLLHWGMFVSFSQTLPQFKILASTATYLERVFVGVFTATRFLAILTAGVVHPALGIFISLLIIFVGSLVLVFTQQISAAAVWAGVILQAIGLATLLPSSLVWGEAYVLMSSQAVAMVCWGLALAELMVPYSMKLLSIDTQTWLGLAMVGTTALATGLFTCVFLLARRHGSRFSRPQASGYELARQDDLVQELLEDDDDDFEVSEPSLELNNTHA